MQLTKANKWKHIIKHHLYSAKCKTEVNKHSSEYMKESQTDLEQQEDG